MYVTYEELLTKIKNTGRSYDLKLINKAYNLAKEAHEGQFRDSGEPYILHPVSVAEILVNLGMDTESIVAALLHDVVEDTEVTLEEVEKEFSKTIAMLVDGVTKLGRIPFSSKEERQAENIRKMLLAMSEDVRVIIIKLCDRLHNLRTLSVRNPQKQRETAKETMEVYSPIAHRLGITTIKEEMEDISIRYLDPYGVKEIEQKLLLHKEDREEIIKQIVEQLKTELSDENFFDNTSIAGRVKSIYGIYRKMYNQGRQFEDIYDIYAVRIIVNDVKDCYNVLGIMHDIFTPIPNRFKDYISMPKPNMYQSLHTTVISKGGIPFEIQIRTWDMHYTADYGVAAHWKYKEGIKKDKLEERLSWVRQLLEVQQESEDSTDIIANIKSDLAPEEVFIFTPNGDIKSLPIGSTIIDFAYAIHSEVGNKMNGAKVNGRITPIDYKLSTGEVVEILTTNAQNHGPSRDWIKIAKTSEARNKIKSWFKKERREENIEEGKEELEREFKRNNVELEEKEREKFIENIYKRHHFLTLEDFYAAIGYGGVSLQKMMQKIKDDYQKIQKQRKRDQQVEEGTPELAPMKKPKGNDGVIVEGLDNCLIKFSKCCNPLPGDDIIGFITRGYGVSIHKRDCENVKLDDEENKGRWVNATWADKTMEDYKSTLVLYASSGNGLLANVSVELNNMRVPLYDLHARRLKNGYNEIVMTIGIQTVEHLKSVIARLQKIPGVDNIQRSANA